MTDTTTTAAATSAPRLLALPEVKKLVGLGTTSIYSKVNSGIFPRPIRLGGRCVRWIESEVVAWLHNCIAARDEGREDA